MPNATIDGPKIEDVNVKKVLVKEITNAMEKAYKFPRQAYVITINEHKPENVGVGGRLVIDMLKNEKYEEK
ncbi:MAG: 4-oxalocrotonate tautomerase family protein [Elusimicrobia bacterium]|nr:4-oxalocrotonate tautomerase family protein [Elusimicrobiota bacterium]